MSAAVSITIFLTISDFQALYLSGTYCHETGIRPPSCKMPREPTIYAIFNIQL